MRRYKHDCEKKKAMELTDCGYSAGSGVIDVLRF